MFFLDFEKNVKNSNKNKNIGLRCPLTLRSTHCSCRRFWLVAVWFVAVLSVAVLVCRRFGQDNLSPFWWRRFGVSPFRFVAVLTIPHRQTPGDIKDRVKHSVGEVCGFSTRCYLLFVYNRTGNQEILLRQTRARCDLFTFRLRWLSISDSCRYFLIQTNSIFIFK